MYAWALIAIIAGQPQPQLITMSDSEEKCRQAQAAMDAKARVQGKVSVAHCYQVKPIPEVIR